MALIKRSRTFYECGCCGCYHPFDFTGDCRDDDNRYSPEDLPKGWMEITQEDADAMLETSLEHPGALLNLPHD